MKSESIEDVFESLTVEKKIQFLRDYEDSSKSKILEQIIKALDDDSIQVRGEAFSSLMLNKNTITKFLINALTDTRKNIRGYASLILANRNEIEASEHLVKLINDESSMVRSCVLGALGYLKIKNVRREIHRCFSDPNLEVRKSALNAVISIGDSISNEEYKILSINKDEEMNMLLKNIIKNGPGGI